MPANVDGMVREGISAYRAGKKDEARALLMRAVEIDEHHEQAWLWLSAVVDSVEEQIICLENVLAINPGNERARQGLATLRPQKPADGAPPKADDDILASASFAPAASDRVSSPFTAVFEEDDDELPTSIEWGAPAPAAPPPASEPPTATSSPSSVRAVKEPSESEYDDWVSSLNLGAGSGSLLGTKLPPVPITEDMTKFMSETFDDEEEDFASLRDTDFGDDLLASGPFSAGEIKPSPAADTSRRAASPQPTASTQPDAFIGDVIGDDLPDEMLEDYDQATLDAPDASELFRFIPQEITPTRLPGTVERYPLPLVLGLLAGIALNAGAVVLLVLQLTAS